MRVLTLAGVEGDLYGSAEFARNRRSPFSRKKKGRGRRLAMAAGGVAALGALSGGAYMLARRGKSATPITNKRRLLSETTSRVKGGKMTHVPGGGRASIESVHGGLNLRGKAGKMKRAAGGYLGGIASAARGKRV